MISDFGWPTCDVCKRPVEQIETERDALSGDTIVTALCHGRHETVRLSPRDLAGDAVIRFTRAFQQVPALP